MFRLRGKTHPGAVREHNEDAFYCDEANGLVVVADGMGGYAAGEVASEIIVKTLQELSPGADKLVATFVECHHRIIAHTEAHPDSKGMGAAVVAAKLGPKQLSVCWAGDSRAYLLDSDGNFKPISRDHSYVQWLLSQGTITEDQARKHPERNLVTQCIGKQPPQPELTTVAWKSGDTLLLCSDGLTDELSDQKIAQLLQEADSTEIALERLIDAAVVAGGKDNITVVLAENLFAPEPSSPRPQGQKQKSHSTVKNPLLPIVLGMAGAGLLVIIGALLYWLS